MNQNATSKKFYLCSQIATICNINDQIIYDAVQKISEEQKDKISEVITAYNERQLADKRWQDVVKSFQNKSKNELKEPKKDIQRNKCNKIILKLLKIKNDAKNGNLSKSTGDNKTVSSLQATQCEAQSQIQQEPKQLNTQLQEQSDIESQNSKSSSE